MSDLQRSAWDFLKSTMRCPVCGRTFEDDPIYEYVKADPNPANLARQVSNYHAARLRFETEGCEAVGLRHVPKGTT